MKTIIELEQELAHTRAALQQQIHSQNIFLHKVSHDLKTPSNATMNALTELEQLSLPASANHLVQLALKACLQSDRMLEQLITLDELNNNQAKVNRTEFSLPAVLEDCLQEAVRQQNTQNEYQSVSLDIDWQYPKENVMAVIGDKRKLSNIIKELLFNALEHTTQGDISIVVSCLEEAPNKVALDITVKDSGRGMTADQLASILTPFANYKDFFHGLHHKAGLSLVLCQKLIQLMAGSFAIKSTLHHGTEVSFRLGFPLAKSSYYLQHHSKNDQTQQLYQPYIRHSEKPVLIVDDDPINRSILCAIARRLGFETKQAGNGQEALDLYDKIQFSLIFMDCQMPIMNGFETTKILRSSRAAREPIIAVSANATDQDIHLCFVAGMDDFVAKPITPHKIAEVMSRWIEHHSDVSKLSN